MWLRQAELYPALSLTCHQNFLAEWPFILSITCKISVWCHLSVGVIAPNSNQNKIIWIQRVNSPSNIIIDCVNKTVQGWCFVNTAEYTVRAAGWHGKFWVTVILKNWKTEFLSREAQHISRDYKDLFKERVFHNSVFKNQHGFPSMMDWQRGFCLHKLAI